MSTQSVSIDDLFKVLMAEYGNRFVRLYDGHDMAEVKARWTEKLDGLKPHHIAYALRHLPESTPPTAGEFLKLCLLAPPAPVRALPAPKPDRRRLREEFAKLRDVLSSERDPRAWIHRLEERRQRGERLTETQMRALQSAAWQLPAEMPPGEFTPIPEHCLPPGMRRSA